MRRLAIRLAVAALVAATVGLGASEPAQASTCSTAHGVSVVVDFHQLGGGVQTRCDRGGAGQTAWDQLDDVGFDLTPVQRQPGFVCRIDGKPSSDQDPCVNTPPSDAYWSLWWSDGTSGSWVFASQGAGTLKVPEGGYVAMSWQSGDGKASPGVSPTPHRAQPTASPTSSPTSRPSSGPPTSSSPARPPTSSAAASSSSSAPSSASGSPSHGDKAGRSGSKPSKKPRDHHQAQTVPADPQAAGPAGHVKSAGTGEPGGSGSPGMSGWVAPVAIAVLFGAVGTIALVRRRRSGGP